MQGFIVQLSQLFLGKFHFRLLGKVFLTAPITSELNPKLLPWFASPV